MILLTTLTVLLDIVLILQALMWAGFLLLVGTAGILMSGINARPGAFEWLLGFVGGLLFPAVITAVVLGAHASGAHWRWRWQVVALVVWTIEYGWVVYAVFTDVVFAGSP
jgi:hypothetical protein